MTNKAGDITKPVNYRCQCGKPEYATWITEDGRQKSIHFTLHPFTGNTLHFKKATMFCERCGTPICEDCKPLYCWGLDGEYAKWNGKDLCHVCDQYLIEINCAEALK